MSMKLERSCVRKQDRAQKQSRERYRTQEMSMDQLRDDVTEREMEGGLEQAGLNESEDERGESLFDGGQFVYDEDLRPLDVETYDEATVSNVGLDSDMFLPRQYEIRVVKIGQCLKCRVKETIESLYYHPLAKCEFADEDFAQRYAMLVRIANYLEKNRQECLQEPDLFFKEGNRCKPKDVYEKGRLASLFSRTIRNAHISWGNIALPLQTIFQRMKRTS